MKAEEFRKKFFSSKYFTLSDIDECMEAYHQQEVEKLLDLLEKAVNGYEWQKSERPEIWDRADEEQLQLCKQALAEYEEKAKEVKPKQK